MMCGCEHNFTCAACRPRDLVDLALSAGDDLPDLDDHDDALTREEVDHAAVR